MTVLGGVELAEERQPDDADDRAAVVDQGERDGAQRNVADEVRGAVNRVQRPIPVAVAVVAVLLTQKADVRRSR